MAAAGERTSWRCRIAKSALLDARRGYPAMSWHLAYGPTDEAYPPVDGTYGPWKSKWELNGHREAFVKCDGRPKTARNT